MKILIFVLLIPSLLLAGYYEEGKQLVKEGKYEEAMQCFDADIAERPDMPFSYSWKVTCLWGLGKYKEAFEFAKYAANKFPDNLISTQTYVMAACYCVDIAAYKYYKEEISKKEYKKALEESIKADDCFLAAAAKHPENYQWKFYSNSQKKDIVLSEWVDNVTLARGICESRIVALETIK